MNLRTIHCVLGGLALFLGPLLSAGALPGQMHITVNSADLKDVLRAATLDTDYNLIFEPGLDTQAHGLNLKAMGLDEILDEVLPKLGLSCSRQGRNLYIQKAGGKLKFYSIEQLAMSRHGTKSFSVNASGQVLQGIGGSGGASNASAYQSTIQMGQATDLWADLESALVLLVFGRTVERLNGGGDAKSQGSRGFSSDGKALIIQPNPGLVGVDASPAIQQRVETYLNEVRKRMGRQVQLEARIVEVGLNNDSQVGVDWTGVFSGGNDPSRLSFSSGEAMSEANSLVRLVVNSGRVSTTLSAMAKDHRLKVLSAPRISALNNQKAILRIVREEAFALTSSQITPGTSAGANIATSQITPLIVPVGIILDIQPQIGDDGTITLSVNPSISSIVKTVTFGAANAKGGKDTRTDTLPVVDRRDLDTVVRIRSGETLVLAGILKSSEAAGNKGIPWLRKVPFLGTLFSRKDKTWDRTELAIFISPTLMEDTDQIETERISSEGRLEAAGADLKTLVPLAEMGSKNSAKTISRRTQ